MMHNRLHREYVTKWRMPKDSDPFPVSEMKEMDSLHLEPTLAQPSTTTWMNIFRRATLLLAIVAILVGYYTYLDRLYLFDEVLEGNALRELTLDEKFTIRVQHVSTLSSLKFFVSHYSLCKSVHEVAIGWEAPVAPPTNDIFTFAHTHSKVTFKWIKTTAHETGLASGLFDASIPTETEGEWHIAMFQMFDEVISIYCSAAVLFLDEDVFVSCDDLTFAHNVWRSGPNAMVGFFPRHTR